MRPPIHRSIVFGSTPTVSASAAGVTPRCSSAVRSLSFAIGRPALRNPRTFTPHHEREMSLVRPQDVLGPRAAYEGRPDQVRLRGDLVPAARQKVSGMTTNHHHSPGDYDDNRDDP